MGVLEDYFNDSKYWNITTCIKSQNLDLIEKYMKNILQQERFNQISRPHPPSKSEALLNKLLSCPWQMNHLLVIGLSLGNLGWTIIKTSHNGFFCRRAKNKIRPRISELSTDIGCDSFIYKIHKIYQGALLEVNAIGQTFVSGYFDDYSLEDMMFYDESINEISGGVNFHLLDVSQKLKAISEPKNIDSKKRQKIEKKLEKLVQQSPKNIEKALYNYRLIHQSSFIRDNEELNLLLCRSNSFWHENHLLYRAYAEPEKLEQDGVKLLFFQTGRLELDPKKKEFWSPITSRKDYGIEQDIPF